MNHLATNLGLMMELLGISAKELSAGLGVDPSVVCRWRSGKRRLSREGAWSKRLADYFLGRAQMAVEELMQSACPLQAEMELDTGRILQDWLCAPPEGGVEALVCGAGKGGTRGDGDCEARRVLRGFLDYVLTLPGPGEILFACPDGLSIFTREGEYNLTLQARLMQVFRRGFRLKTVLRTDYRVSDVALASGPWLSAHLQGYIESRYYDDFRLCEDEETLICLPGRLAIQVTVGKYRTTTQVWTDEKRVASAQSRFQHYHLKAQPRFQYGFLDGARGFLAGRQADPRKPSYLFQRLPHLGLLPPEHMAALFALTPKEMAYLLSQFAPLMSVPEARPAPTCHLLDADAIDRALDQERHLCHALSWMLGRRVYLSAGKLAQVLLYVRRLLGQCPQYHLLCLPGQAFDGIGMELGVWGNEAVVAWISGAKPRSAACRDYPNVSALNGFCATLFQAAGAGRPSAASKLDTWLKRAQKMALLPKEG